ncbi:MAG: hypothetical protein J5553_05170 [Verrucomicrobia bacterium]|nr:hypothetical protein [Verrucomicrobiota bacterium]
MKSYYFVNRSGRVQSGRFENDRQAFVYCVMLNWNKGENWKTYDERGNLIHGVFQHGAESVSRA